MILYSKKILEHKIKKWSNSRSDLKVAATVHFDNTNHDDQILLEKTWFMTIVIHTPSQFKLR